MEGIPSVLRRKYHIDQIPVEQYYSADLEQGFCNMVAMNRECYMDTQGLEEEVIAQRYEYYLHALELYYPKTARVLQRLVACYREEARQACNSMDIE